MQFKTSTVTRTTRSGKTYTTFLSAPVPAPTFSLSPCLTAAYEREDIVDIEAALDDITSNAYSASKRGSVTAGLSGDGSNAKRPRTTGNPSATTPAGNTPANGASQSNRALRNKSRHRSDKKKKKADAFATMGQPSRIQDAKLNISRQSVSALAKDLDFDALPASSSGYEAVNKGSSGSKAPRTLEQVKKEMPVKQYIAWDGINPIIITDPATGRVVFVGVGRPDDPRYAASLLRACEAILLAGTKIKLDKDHRRGRGFGARNVGILHQQGPKKPYNLRTEPVLEDLLANPDVERMATFQSAAFGLFLPKLYVKYHTLRTDVENHMDLKWNFPRSVFSAAAFNFGPQVVCARHRDSMNLPAGYCAITALGDFDPKLGGHLVIEELGIIVEFPPGSCALIPSAVFTHSNTSIQPGETRVSFTQYSSGGLFRFADNGYRTEEGLKAYDLDQYEYMMERKRTRWERDLSLWPTLDEILEQIEDTEDDIESDEEFE
ncbi:hypothetical protein DFP72DRAFT_861224 [Ephemerocybe angulata]|uniref:Uncharacterized protein n=1 Tax=Ephemerocybe angulata TaxID=980116 RepID=A0A8H6LTE2_9AGAR|nr:hypothetical protein DFP72DRAFT_861224 [Tulosesus angulatus]